MKLYQVPISPFVRIARATAHVKGLTDRIELVNRPDAGIESINPSNKVPTLETDDGEVLIESRLIAQYFDEIGSGPRLYPEDAAERRRVLQHEAVVLGVMDATALTRNERRKETEPSRWWLERQRCKRDHGLDRFEGEIDAFTKDGTIVPIELCCARALMDWAVPDHDWRKGHPKLAAWYEAYSKTPHMAATDVRDPGGIAETGPTTDNASAEKRT